MSGNVFGLLLNYRDAPRSVCCVQSLLSNGVSHVLVWDNSADEERSAFAIRSAFTNDPRVEICCSAVNLGFAAGVNRALAICTARDHQSWVLLINNDAQLLSGGLSRLIVELDRTPQACIAFPDINHAGQILGPAYANRFTGLLSWSPKAGRFSYASGCCMLLALDRMDIPLFDEDFFMYGEDCELGWRLSQRPGALLHVNETLVEHEGSKSSGMGSPFYENSMVAAHLTLARKLARSSRERWLFLFCRGLMLIVRALIRSIRFGSLVPVKALWLGRQIAMAPRHDGNARLTS